MTRDKDDITKLFSAGIKSAVDLTNGGLSRLERFSTDVRTPVSSSIKTLNEQTTNALASFSHYYAMRREFAPQIIGGSSLLAGSFMALRRGRIAGLLGASFFGASAYGLVYDDIVFGTKN